jgi:hypothetical protein
VHVRASVYGFNLKSPHVIIRALAVQSPVC